jgi:UDP-glucose 4-epimerase
MSRRILITGGAGFIGSHLVERLVRQGDDVHVLDDLSKGRREWLPEGLPIHRTDLRDPGPVRRVVTDVVPNVVMHLAALHFIPAVDGAPALAWQINVEGTRALLDALVERPPQVVLFTSTAAVYPDRSGPISEACPVAPLDLYGRTKAAAEELVSRYETQTGVRCVIARLFNVIGERETNPHVVPELIEQLKAGNTILELGKLDARRDYTHVADVADALARLLEPSLPDSLFNVGSGRGVSVAELVSACERILGRSLSVRVDQRRLRETDRDELIADVRRLRGATRWAPTRSTDDTLSELLADA